MRRGVFTLGTCSLLLCSACPEPAAPDVPPVTTASTAASPAPLASDVVPLELVRDAGAPEPPVIAAFVDVPGTTSGAICGRVMIAVAKGKVSVLSETLGPGDVLVVTHPDDLKLEGNGLVVAVTRMLDDCHVRSRPAVEKTVVRGAAAPELRWAKGGMSAHLDVGKTLSPDVYLGRLEGTANVAEHEHPGSWEIVADIEASGTFVIDGAQTYVGARQITFIPPGVKHAYRPDPGTKLVAIQMYSPPGPEQRFVALSAADRDAGSAIK